jgi:endo-1,4-beta-xylanase
MKIINFTTIFAIAYCLISCTEKEKIDSLKSAYEGDFYIGTAVNSAQIAGEDSLANSLLESDFNSITPENIMKCEVIHPEWDSYNFTEADKYVALGQKNKMFVVGHTLIWHSQLSPFVQKISTADSLKLFMENHINTIAGRYSGKVNGWDVVNEALEEDGTLRKSIFLEKLGEGYLAEAFKLAEKAAPNTELYYNDYNIEQPAKRAGAIELIKKIQASGARIDGVGIQGHWSINGPPIAELEKSIEEFSALGLKVMITELDLTALPNPWDLKGADVGQDFENSAIMNPYTAGLPDSMQVKLAQGYEDLFKLFLKHKKHISRVTFLGYK